MYHARYHTRKLIMSLIIGLTTGLIFGYWLTQRPCVTTLDSRNEAKKLIHAMHDVWLDHAVWSSDFIAAFFARTPDQNSMRDRLLQNEDDIAALLAPYYGKEAANKLGSLLKEHIMIAVKRFTALRDKEGDPAAIYTQARDNDQDVAEFLSSLNPHWNKDTFIAMLKEHADLTHEMLQARLKEDWDGEVKAFDSLVKQSRDLADVFAQGIIKQFPNRF